MNLASGLARERRRSGLIAGLAICVVAGALSFALWKNGSAGASASAVTTESSAKFRLAVIARLRAAHLNYHWVVCVPSGNRFHGVRIVRCNVDFGEPHIVAYCSVLRDGRLLTSEEDPTIPCGHDNAGFSDPVVTYG